LQGLRHVAAYDSLGESFSDRRFAHARLTDEVMAGTIAVPHGWGHDGGWQMANAAGGANTNVLASSEPEDLERLAGMAHLNGIAVRVELVAAGRRAPVETAVAAGGS